MNSDTDTSATAAAEPAGERVWARDPAEVAAALTVDPAQGLSREEAAQRLRRYGRNALGKAQRQSAFRILLEQFNNVLALLLTGAVILSFALGEVPEGAAIAVVILLNAAIGFVAEIRAVRSMEALRSLGRMTTRVRRGGSLTEIPAEEVVPGDIVVLEGGDVVSADLRILEASRLQANESALTGESLPVAKHPDPDAADTVLAERRSMLYRGTAVTRGAGVGVVVATGVGTELGKISELVMAAEGERSPLEKRLTKLSAQLLYAAVAVTALAALAGVLRGQDPILMLQVGIALAVAAVPEGLPIVATLALARGMWRMARKNALIERLSAVETLGATTVILSDKTGTMTENRMTVTDLMTASGHRRVTGKGIVGTDESHPADTEAVRRALRIGVLCASASFDPETEEATGDPMEVALLRAGALEGFTRESVLEELPEVAQEAFDAEVRMMATVHKTNVAYLVAVKGAPEAVLDASREIAEDGGRREMTERLRVDWLARNEALAREGLRVIAVAEKETGDPDDDPYHGLTFIGLIGFRDPPRPDVKPAIEACRDAGIRVVMVTGDNAATASAIAGAVGLTDDVETPALEGKNVRPPGELDEAGRAELAARPVFARVNPAQKLDLVTLHQDAGEIVAMTGDGVNDAPALKKADIGIAMGQRGTQVAKDAADMILRDDAFPTIVTAIREGRVIFANIRAFVIFLLSCNLSEIMVVALANISGMPLPLLPLQLLFLNLVTDVFPALALGANEAGRNVLRQPPRDPQESILTRAHWLEIMVYGFLLTAAVLGAFTVSHFILDETETQSVTVAFLTLAFAQLWHVFNMRSRGSGPFDNEVIRNRFVWGAVVLCVFLVLGAVYLPGLADILSLEAPRNWGLILGASVAPLLIAQIARIILRR